MTQETGLCKGAAGQEGRKHPLGFGSTIGPGREPLGEASQPQLGRTFLLLFRLSILISSAELGFFVEAS